MLALQRAMPAIEAAGGARTVHALMGGTIVHAEHSDREGTAHPDPQDDERASIAIASGEAMPAFSRFLPLTPGEALSAIETAKAHLAVCAPLMALRRMKQSQSHAAAAKRRMRRLILAVFGPDALPPAPVLRPKKFDKGGDTGDGNGDDDGNGDRRGDAAGRTAGTG